MLVLLYSVIINVAYLFDRTNNLFNISLISIVTLGWLKYTDDLDCKDKKGYVGSAKVLKISLACMTVGFFVVSGGVFSFIAKIIFMFNGVV